MEEKLYDLSRAVIAVFVIVVSLFYAPDFLPFNNHFGEALELACVGEESGKGGQDEPVEDSLQRTIRSKQVGGAEPHCRTIGRSLSLVERPVAHIFHAPHKTISLRNFICIYRI